MRKNQEKFKITNSTIKPPRMVGGKDVRSAVEKVGHPVQFRDAQDRIIMIMPNKFRIVSEVSEGMMGLQRGGFVQIEEVKDMATALKDYSYSQRQERMKAAAEAKESSAKAAHAVEMGKDSHQSKSGSEHDGAVNPDGDPNFLVKAPRGKRGRTKKARVQAEM